MDKLKKMYVTIYDGQALSRLGLLGSSKRDGLPLASLDIELTLYSRPPPSAILIQSQ